MLRSYADYRKQNLLARKWISGIREGVNLQFDALRFDLLEAVKLPELLFEGSVDANAAYKIARKIDTEEVTEAVEEIIRFCKSNFYKSVIAEAAAALAAGNPLDTFKAELIADVRKKIAVLKQRVGDILGIARGTSTPSDLGPAGDAGGAGSPAAAGGSGTGGAGSPAAAGGAGGSGGTGGRLDPSSFAGSIDTHHGRGPHGVGPSGPDVDADGNRYSNWYRRPYNPDTDFDSSKAWRHQRGERNLERPRSDGSWYRPAPYGQVTPHDGWWNGLKRVVSGLWRKGTRGIRQSWHDHEPKYVPDPEQSYDPNKPYVPRYIHLPGRDHTEVLGNMLSEHKMGLFRILNENQQQVFQVIDDFEADLIQYIDQRVSDFFKSSASAAGLPATPGAVDAVTGGDDPVDTTAKKLNGTEPEDAATAAAVAGGAGKPVPGAGPASGRGPVKNSRGGRGPARADKAGTDPSNISGLENAPPTELEKRADMGDQHAQALIADTVENLTAGAERLGITLSLKKKQKRFGGGHHTDLGKKIFGSIILLDGQPLETRTPKDLLNHIYKTFYVNVMGKQPPIQGTTRRINMAVNPHAGLPEELVKVVNDCLNFKEMNARGYDFVKKFLLTVGHLVKTNTIPTKGPINPDVIRKAIQGTRVANGEAAPEADPVVDAELAPETTPAGGAGPLTPPADGGAGPIRTGRGGRRKKLVDPNALDPNAGADYPAKASEFAERLNSEHPDVIENMIAKLPPDTNGKPDEWRVWNHINQQIKSGKTPQQVYQDVMVNFGGKSLPAPVTTPGETPPVTPPGGGGTPPVTPQNPAVASSRVQELTAIFDKYIPKGTNIRTSLDKARSDGILTDADIEGVMGKFPTVDDSNIRDLLIALNDTAKAKGIQAAKAQGEVAGGGSGVTPPAKNPAATPVAKDNDLANAPKGELEVDEDKINQLASAKKINNVQVELAKKALNYAYNAPNATPEDVEYQKRAAAHLLGFDPEKEMFDTAVLMRRKAAPADSSLPTPPGGNAPADSSLPTPPGGNAPANGSLPPPQSTSNEPVNPGDVQITPADIVQISKDDEGKEHYHGLESYYNSQIKNYPTGISKETGQPITMTPEMAARNMTLAQQPGSIGDDAKKKLDADPLWAPWWKGYVSRLKKERHAQRGAPITPPSPQDPTGGNAPTEDQDEGDPAWQMKGDEALKYIEQPHNAFTAKLNGLYKQLVRRHGQNGAKQIIDDLTGKIRQVFKTDPQGSNLAWGIDQVQELQSKYQQLEHDIYALFQVIKDTEGPDRAATIVEDDLLRDIIHPAMQKDPLGNNIDWALGKVKDFLNKYTNASDVSDITGGSVGKPDEEVPPPQPTPEARPAPEVQPAAAGPVPEVRPDSLTSGSAEDFEEKLDRDTYQQDLVNKLSAQGLSGKELAHAVAERMAKYDKNPAGGKRHKNRPEGGKKGQRGTKGRKGAKLARGLASSDFGDDERLEDSVQHPEKSLGLKSFSERLDAIIKKVLFKETVQTPKLKANEKLLFS
jgi:hypothetical protein